MTIRIKKFSRLLGLPLALVWLALAASAGANEAITFIEAQYDGAGLDGAVSVVLSPDGRYVYVAGELDNAVAVFSRDELSGALSWLEAQRNGAAGVRGLAGVRSIAMSPDGQHVYAAGQFDDALVLFSRDQTTGRLSFIEVYENGVAGLAGLDGARAVALSPDGQYVYVTGFYDHSLVVFSRDEATGALNTVEIQQEGVGDVIGLTGARSVTVSPDGRHIYVAGATDNAVAVFSRDGTGGGLSFVEAQQNGVAGVEGLAFASSVGVSPDGRHLYVASAEDDAVVVFERDHETGGLSFTQINRDGTQDVEGLNGASSVMVSPDGRHVYVTSQFDNRLVVFGRDQTSGMLTLLGICDNIGLDFARSVAVSPDGYHVYVASLNDDAVLAFSRNRDTGALILVEVQYNNTGGVNGLAFANSVTISPDGRHVYATGASDQALSVFSRDEATGLLSFVEAPQNGINGVSGLAFVSSVALSPDGRHLYAAGVSDHALTVFSRDELSGKLNFIALEQDGLNGVDGLLGAVSVIVSPDGRHVYVASQFDNAVVAFSRDETTGQLNFIELKKDGADEVDGLLGTRSITISPDGRHVYAAGSDDNAAAVFSRDETTGRLSFVELHRNGIGGLDQYDPDGIRTVPSNPGVINRRVYGLRAASSIAVSPDGRHVYVTGAADDALAIFSRDQARGTLRFVEVKRNLVNNIEGLNTPNSITVSPNGQYVYVAGGTEIIPFGTLAVFERDEITGELTFIEVKKNGIDSVNGLNFAQSVVVSPDGRHLYVTGAGDDALALFRVNSQNSSE